MTTGLGSPCGACKCLRRKCVQGCVFAPYFCHEQGAMHFAAIHKVFGASNASKLLVHLPPPDRGEAAVTISYEAQARLHDPIYGCVSHIFALKHKVACLQAQLAYLKAQQAAGNDSSNHNLDTFVDAFENVAGCNVDINGFKFPDQAGASNQLDGDFMIDHGDSNSHHYHHHFRSYSLDDDDQFFSLYGCCGGEQGGSAVSGGWTSNECLSDIEELQSAALAYLHRSG